jgi:hypothetical protein
VEEGDVLRGAHAEETCLSAHFSNEERQSRARARTWLICAFPKSTLLISPPVVASNGSTCLLPSPYDAYLDSSVGRKPFLRQVETPPAGR